MPIYIYVWRRLQTHTHGLILKDDGTVKTREMHGFVYYAKRAYRSGGASRVSWVKWYKV